LPTQKLAQPLVWPNFEIILTRFLSWIYDLLFTVRRKFIFVKSVLSHVHWHVTMWWSLCLQLEDGKQV